MLRLADGLIGSYRALQIFSTFVIMAPVFTLMAPAGFAADGLSWGPTVNGLRLGAAFGSDSSKRTLRTELQNVGPEFIDVMIGHEAVGMIYDSLKFVATAPDGKEITLIHRSLYTVIAGLLLPFSVGLKAGESYSLELSLKDIIHASATEMAGSPLKSSAPV